MHTESAKRVCCCLDSLYALVHSDIPQFDLAAPAAAYKLALAASLKVYVGNPLFVLFPYFHHGLSGFLALVINSYRSVTEPCNEDITFDLIRSQGRNA